MLAVEIITQLHSREEAQKAAKISSISVHISDELRTLDLPVTHISGTTIADAIFETGNATSKSESKRLIEQGGVEFIALQAEKIEPVVIKNAFYQVPGGENIIRIGKKKLIKIKK